MRKYFYLNLSTLPISMMFQNVATFCKYKTKCGRNMGYVKAYAMFVYEIIFFTQNIQEAYSQ